VTAKIGKYDGVYSKDQNTNRLSQYSIESTDNTHRKTNLTRRVNFRRYGVNTDSKVDLDRMTSPILTYLGNEFKPHTMSMSFFPGF
jgi:hypothetical protein